MPVGFISGGRDYAAIDGRSSAPIVSGGPQFPTLLSSYPYRPPWQVAGIDYPVGIPSSVSLSDPTLITGMTGVSVDAVNKFIRILRAAGNTVTLDGYDFSLHGGYKVYISGVGNGGGASVVIQNCYFKVGANKIQFIQSETDAGPLTIQFCEGNGSGLENINDATATLDNPSIGFGGGAGVMLYNRWTNIRYDVCNFTTTTSFVAKFNLIDSCSYLAAAHFDALQSIGGPINGVVVNFNTLYQPAADGDGWPGSINSLLRIGDLSGTISNSAEAGWNSIVVVGADGHNPTKSHPAIGTIFQLAANQAPAGIINNPYIHDNYVSDTDAMEFGLNYPESSGAPINNSLYNHNVNMTTGALIAKAL